MSNNPLQGYAMNTEEYLSATSLSKKTSATLNRLEKGEADKLIILKNNAPKAILMSMDAYAAMEEELEDLRLAALAMARYQTFDMETAVSHHEMMERFAK
jgi:antitoxin StbD